jgi:hypothetical protein
VPVNVFAAEEEMRWNNTRTTMKYFGRSNTEIDTWVVLTDADVSGWEPLLEMNLHEGFGGGTHECFHTRPVVR